MPYIRENILEEKYYESSNELLQDQMVYYTSGTSSGERKKVIYSPRDHSYYLQHRKKVISDFLSATQYRRACADLGTGHAAASAKHIFTDLGYATKDIDFTQPIQEHIALINEYQPEILFTMPMILESMIHADTLTHRFKKIILVGDVASQEWQKTVAEYFHIAIDDILDLYGTIEVGAIAFYNHDTKLYHFHDHIIPEMVDPKHFGFEYERTNVSLGVLTSLKREYFPAVRYVTNDLFQGYQEIEYQGKRVSAFSHILGRVGLETKHGEKLSLHDISSAIAKYIPGARFEIEKNLTECIIKIASTTCSQEALDAVKNDLYYSNPDIHYMAKAGLIKDIIVKKVSIEKLQDPIAKKKYKIGL